jgi:tetratricopeptide (TPR) repeat protein
MSEGGAPNIFLLGVSIPRSGHHFLATLLEQALGADIRYCEYYSKDDCCKDVPCSRARQHRVTYQKNHDMELTLDTNLPGVSYLVQFREPIPAVVSDRELFAAVYGSQLAADRAQYLLFLAEKAAHYTRFYDKWVRPARASAFMVKYEQLRDDPAAVLEGLFRFCALDVPRERIDQAIAAVAPVINRTPLLKDTTETAFVPRVPSQSKYFDPDLLAVYESLLLDRVPELAAHRVFAPVDYSGHLLFALYNLRCATLDGRLDEVARLACDAQAAWPEHLHLNAIAGDTLWKLGQHEAALPYMEKAVALAPHDAEMLVPCANAHISLGNLGRAVELATALVGLAPDDPSHRIFLSTILVMAGRRAEALEQALHALHLGIGDPHLWRGFGYVVHEARAEGWILQVAAVNQPR